MDSAVFSSRSHDRATNAAAVIIPARNAAETLGEQLAALAAQNTDFPWEVIVVDNGSTDDTVGVAEGFREWITNLRVIQCERRGANAARNEGARHTTSDRLLYCDADDRVAPGWVASLAAGLDVFDSVGGHIDNDSFDRGHMPPHPEGIPIVGGFLPRAITANFGVRRSVWLAVGGFSESYAYGATDTEFCWRVQLAGYSLGYIKGASVAYRARVTLADATRKAYLTGQSRARLYRDFKQAGMPRPSILGAAWRWTQIVLTAPVAIVSERARWATLRGAAGATGRMVGSFRNRVLYL